MATVVSRGSGLFRRKKKPTIIEDDEEKTRLIKALSKRLKTLSKKMAAIKVRLHDTSLAYLQLVRRRLQEKIGRNRPNRRTSVERRKLPRMVIRMEQTASAVLARAPRGKVMTFPAAQDSSVTPDR